MQVLLLQLRCGRLPLLLLQDCVRLRLLLLLLLLLMLMLLVPLLLLVLLLLLLLQVLLVHEGGVACEAGQHATVACLSISISDHVIQQPAEALTQLIPLG